MFDEVRWAAAEDADAIASLHIRAWRAAYRDLGSDEVLSALSIVDRAQRWRRRLTDPSPGSFTAVAGSGWPVGFCSGMRQARDADLDPHTAELAALYVAPERWREGLGSALLQVVCGRLAEEGAAAVALWVFTANAPGLAFYERHGFEPDGARRPDPGTGLAEVRLRRPLPLR